MRRPTKGGLGWVEVVESHRPDTGLAHAAEVLIEALGEGDALPPVHPGEILLEEFMKPLDLGTTRTARRMNVPRTRVERIVRGEMGVTPDTALRLERLFGASAEFWLTIQTSYDLAVARSHADPVIAQIEPVMQGAA